jgi:hypothetical protein
MPTIRVEIIWFYVRRSVQSHGAPKWVLLTMTNNWTGRVAGKKKLASNVKNALRMGRNIKNDRARIIWYTHVFPRTFSDLSGKRSRKQTQEAIQHRKRTPQDLRERRFFEIQIGNLSRRLKLIGRSGDSPDPGQSASAGILGAWSLLFEDSAGVCFSSAIVLLVCLLYVAEFKHKHTGYVIRTCNLAYPKSGAANHLGFWDVCSKLTWRVKGQEKKEMFLMLLFSSRPGDGIWTRPFLLQSCPKMKSKFQYDSYTKVAKRQR